MLEMLYPQTLPSSGFTPPVPMPSHLNPLPWLRVVHLQPGVKGLLSPQGSSCFGRGGPWVFWLLPVQLCRCLSLPGVGEEQEESAHSLPLLFRELVCTPLCGGLDCALAPCVLAHPLRPFSSLNGTASSGVALCEGSPTCQCPRPRQGPGSWGGASSGPLDVMGSWSCRGPRQGGQPSLTLCPLGLRGKGAVEVMGAASGSSLSKGSCRLPPGRRQGRPRSSSSLLGPTALTASDGFAGSHSDLPPGLPSLSPQEP